MREFVVLSPEFRGRKILSNIQRQRSSIIALQPQGEVTVEQTKNCVPTPAFDFPMVCLFVSRDPHAPPRCLMRRPTNGATAILPNRALQCCIPTYFGLLTICNWFLQRSQQRPTVEFQNTHSISRELNQVYIRQHRLFQDPFFRDPGQKPRRWVNPPRLSDRLRVLLLPPPRLNV